MKKPMKLRVLSAIVCLVMAFGSFAPAALAVTDEASASDLTPQAVQTQQPVLPQNEESPVVEPPSDESVPQPEVLPVQQPEQPEQEPEQPVQEPEESEQEPEESEQEPEEQPEADVNSAGEPSFDAQAVGEVSTFAALKSAFDNASTDSADPTQVKLTANIDCGAQELNLASGKYLVLDLNGKELYNTADSDFLSNYGVLTILDGSSAKNGVIYSSVPNSYRNLYNYGTLTLQSGSLGNDEFNVSVLNRGTFNMNGGKIYATNALANYGSATLSGGEFAKEYVSYIDQYANGAVLKLGGVKFTHYTSDYFLKIRFFYDASEGTDGIPSPIELLCPLTQNIAVEALDETTYKQVDPQSAPLFCSSDSYTMTAADAARFVSPYNYNLAFAFDPLNHQVIVSMTEIGKIINEMEETGVYTLTEDLTLTNNFIVSGKYDNSLSKYTATLNLNGHTIDCGKYRIETSRSNLIFKINPNDKTAASITGGKITGNGSVVLMVFNSMLEINGTIVENTGESVIETSQGTTYYTPAKAISIGRYATASITRCEVYASTASECCYAIENDGTITSIENTKLSGYTALGNMKYDDPDWGYCGVVDSIGGNAEYPGIGGRTKSEIYGVRSGIENAAEIGNINDCTIGGVSGSNYKYSFNAIININNGEIGSIGSGCVINSSVPTARMPGTAVSNYSGTIGSVGNGCVINGDSTGIVVFDGVVGLDRDLVINTNSAQSYSVHLAVYTDQSGVASGYFKLLAPLEQAYKVITASLGGTSPFRGTDSYTITQADVSKLLLLSYGVSFKLDTENNAIVTCKSVMTTVNTAAKLREALENASSDDNNPTRITLSANINMGSAPLLLPEGTFCTLDLNGKTLSGSVGGALLTNLGELEITDTSAAANGQIVNVFDTRIVPCVIRNGNPRYYNPSSTDPTSWVIDPIGSAKLTINGGTIGKNAVTRCVGIGNNAQFVMNSGAVYGTAALTNYGVAALNGGTLCCPGKFTDFIGSVWQFDCALKTNEEDSVTTLSGTRLVANTQGTSGVRYSMNVASNNIKLSQPLTEAIVFYHESLDFSDGVLLFTGTDGYTMTQADADLIQGETPNYIIKRLEGGILYADYTEEGKLASRLQRFGYTLNDDITLTTDLHIKGDWYPYLNLNGHTLDCGEFSIVEDSDTGLGGLKICSQTNSNSDYYDDTNTLVPGGRITGSGSATLMVRNIRDVSIKDVTIENTGTALQGEASHWAIHNYGSNITIVNSEIIGSQAAGGGGIMNQGCLTSVSYSSISGYTALDNGISSLGRNGVVELLEHVTLTGSRTAIHNVNTINRIVGCEITASGANVYAAIDNNGQIVSISGLSSVSANGGKAIVNSGTIFEIIDSAMQRIDVESGYVTLGRGVDFGEGYGVLLRSMNTKTSGLHLFGSLDREVKVTYVGTVNSGYVVAVGEKAEPIRANTLRFVRLNEASSGLVFDQSKNTVVYSNLAPTAVKLNKTSLTIGNGEQVKLSATFTPSASDSAITWSSSDESITIRPNYFNKMECYCSAEGVGKATVTITTGNGKKATCVITVKKSINESWIDFTQGDTYEYTGFGIEPAITVFDGTKNLVKGRDYTVSYNYNIRPSDHAWVTLTGKGEYAGSTTVYFEIVRKELTEDMLEPYASEQYYTGSALNPFKLSYGGKALVEDVDYHILFADGDGNGESNNIEIGSVRALILGNGGFSGQLEKTFEIVATPLDASMAASIPTQTYTGNAIEPELQVAFGGRELTAGTDYTVSWESNTAAGTATAHVQGIGHYGGEFDKTFVIAKAKLSASVLEQLPPVTYDGAAKTPAISFVDSNVRYVNGVDYQLTYRSNVNAGTASIAVKGIGSCTGSFTVKFVIQKAELSAVTIADITEVTYSGAALKPAPVLSHSGRTLVLNKDYTVSYSDNVNVGTATVTIKGKGSYQGTEIKTFEIVANSTLSITPIKAQTYTGKELKPAFAVKSGSRTLKAGVDYTVDYTNNTAAGTARATVSGIGNYTSSTSADFVINPLAITKTQIYVPSQTKLAGSSATVAPTIMFGNTTLGENTDYTLRFENNTAVGTAKVIISGSGNFGGSVTKTFRVVSGNTISDCTIAAITAQTYTGSQIKPLMQVEDSSGTPLTLGRDYTVAYKNNTNVGTAVATLSGKGTYSGNKVVTFEISSKALANSEVTFAAITDKVFTGAEIKPAASVKWGRITLRVNKDYTVSYANNRDVGTATMTLALKGNYSGTLSKTFNVTQCPMSKVSISSIASKYYTGSQLTPEPIVKLGRNVLVKDVDYTVNYSNNVNVGTVWVDINGRGNITGHKSVTFKITKHPMTAADITVTGISDSEYQGEEVKFSGIVVKCGEDVLRRGVDYTLAYSNNAKVGTGKVTVTGIGECFSGKRTVSFRITGGEFNAYSIYTDYIYTGSQQKPSPTVYDVNTNSVLKVNKDYSLKYIDNIKAGTATVVIAGRGNYAGCERTLSFNIIPRTTALTVAAIRAQSYDGRAKYPTVTVKDGRKTLKAGVDYVVGYENNVYAGTASVHVTGVGNYSSDCKASAGFSIVMPKAAFTRVKNVAEPGESGVVEMNWRTVNGAQGYKIQYSLDKSFASCSTITIDDGTVNRTTQIGLYTNKTWYFRIAALDGNTPAAVGPFSSVYSVRVTN